MPQPTSLDLAKQGDPHAIAALINQTLHPKGITVKASLKGNCLQLLLESAKPLDRQPIVAFITKGLTSLNPQGIEVVKICSQQVGEAVPSWIDEMHITSHLITMPTGSAPETIEQYQSEEDKIRCPRCRSTQIVAQKKGFGGGKALAGAVLLGPVGLAGGFIGANNINLTCMKCACRWDPNKPLPAIVPPPKLNPNPQPTKVKVKRTTFSERFGIGLLSAFFMGLFVCIFSRPAALFIAILIFWGCLLIEDWSTSLIGDCPYCGKETSASLSDKAVKCKNCSHQIKVEANQRRGTFSPS